MSAPRIINPATAGGGVPVGGSGAAGYVAKWTAATTLGGSTTTGATASLYVDATGQVGIGTASPTHKLQVVGELGLYNAGVDAVYGDVLFMGASPYQTTFRHKIKASISATSVSSLMTFSLTSGASTFIDVMTLRGDGNVGIGTASPTKKLDVNGSANVTGALTVAGSVSRTSGSTAGVLNGAFIVVPVPETYKALLLSSTTNGNETSSSLHLIGSDTVNCNVAALNVFQTTVANNGAAASVRITNGSGVTEVKWSFLQIS